MRERERERQRDNEIKSYRTDTNRAMHANANKSVNFNLGQLGNVSKFTKYNDSDLNDTLNLQLVPVPGNEAQHSFAS